MARRRISHFAKLSVEELAQEKDQLQAQIGALAAALESNNHERVALDEEMEDKRDALADLNRVHGDIERDVHLLRGELAALETIERTYTGITPSSSEAVGQPFPVAEVSQ